MPDTARQLLDNCRTTPENNVISPVHELGRQSLQFRGPIIWNSLNKELKKQTNRETFKRQLKSNMKTLNKLSFGNETTFNTNRDENYGYF